MRKCLILAAGKGSRMGNPAIHKGLYPICGKAIISSAIENIKCEEFIIAVGYNSQQVIDYCSCAHPNVKIKFITIENYDQPGSGPGHSMSCCRNELQEPFYITTADSFINSPLPQLKEDWIGITKVKDPQNYSTCDIDEKSYIKKFQNKSLNNYKDYAFTGIMGVYNYTNFWKKFDDYVENNKDKEVEVVGVLYEPSYEKIKGIDIEWHDTGRKNLYETLKKNTSSFASYELPKINISEFTYKINNKILKIAPPEIIIKKKKRSSFLGDLIPKICCKNYENVLAYNFVEGKTLYEFDNLKIFIDFINWCEKTLFNGEKKEPFPEEIIKNFYFNKTMNRVKKFTEIKNINWCDVFTINNFDCLSIEETLKDISWEKIISKPIIYPFHGDLNFGNVIIDDKNKFKLIDWRESFEDQIYGDLYYDLAKIYAGSLVNFMVASKHTHLLDKTSVINIADCQTENTKKFILFYEDWIVKNNYDLKKVKLIAFLSYLNMSPLHPEDFGEYLFYKGILEINKILKNE
jgi:dTDP-glucose pyrophosphorylase/thiamine kinase-like enzyme